LPRRPFRVTAISVFFLLGAGISALSFVALLVPGSALEPMWRLNPRAREQFASMGHWSLGLMGVVSVLCASAALGLWRGRRYGFVLGLALLAVSLLGDLANAVFGVEPRAWFGVPVSLLLIFLLKSAVARRYFASPATTAGTPDELPASRSRDWG